MTNAEDKTIERISLPRIERNLNDLHIITSSAQNICRKTNRKKVGARSA